MPVVQHVKRCVIMEKVKNLIVEKKENSFDF